MNVVGKSHFLLKYCGLSSECIDHIKLLVNHDLARYEENKAHLERMARQQSGVELPGPGGYYTGYGDGEDDEYQAAFLVLG